VGVQAYEIVCITLLHSTSATHRHRIEAQAAACIFELIISCSGRPSAVLHTVVWLVTVIPPASERDGRLTRGGHLPGTAAMRLFLTRSTCPGGCPSCELVKSEGSPSRVRCASVVDMLVQCLRLGSTAFCEVLKTHPGPTQGSLPFVLYPQSWISLAHRLVYPISLQDYLSG
jgi:hypothetical protein